MNTKHVKIGGKKKATISNKTGNMNAFMYSQKKGKK
jgi:hypothetical protein